MTEMIQMSHPSSKGVSRTSRAAFTKHWEKKGWVEVKAGSTEAPAETPDKPEQKGK